MHRRGARRPGTGRLRHSGGDPPCVSERPAACGRSGLARRNAGGNDARGRCLGAALRAMTARDERPLTVRLKTKKKRTVSQKRWLERQLNDPYVARAKREGLRSRAAFKLAEIDAKHPLLKAGARIVDLGAAPGGWSQVAAKRVGAAEGRGRVVAIDVLEMEPIAGVEFLR